jgi:hypothetical protein
LDLGFIEPFLRAGRLGEKEKVGRFQEGREKLLWPYLVFPPILISPLPSHLPPQEAEDSARAISRVLGIFNGQANGPTAAAGANIRARALSP